MVTRNFDAIDQSVRDYIAAGSGIDINNVIRGNTNQPTPPDVVFATVTPINIMVDGIPYTTYRADPDNVPMLLARTVMSVIAQYSVQFHLNLTQPYGTEQVYGNPTNHSREFTMWVSSPIGREFAVANDLTFRQVIDPFLSDNVFGGDWEPGNTLTLEIGYNQSITQSIDVMTEPGDLTVAIQVGYETAYYQTPEE